MIVIIFVTQNKFLRSPGISDRLLGFLPSESIRDISYQVTAHRLFRLLLALLFFSGNPTRFRHLPSAIYIMFPMFIQKVFEGV